ncbi:MAG: hypothetical protein GYA60_07040 [Candidatus Methanofastidiosa archaeon]|nr:hypothetical protein [Candidatus Methanofastidiosa archaeon]
MTPTQEFIIALITVLAPIIIPYVIRLFFEAYKARLEAIKAKTDNYKETIQQLVITAEAMFKEGNGQAKLEWVLDKASATLGIPKDNLRQLVETVLLETKNAFKQEWDKLGTP